MNPEEGEDIYNGDPFKLREWENFIGTALGDWKLCMATFRAERNWRFCLTIYVFVTAHSGTELSVDHAKHVLYYRAIFRAHNTLFLNCWHQK